MHVLLVRQLGFESCFWKVKTMKSGEEEWSAGAGISNKSKSDTVIVPPPVVCIFISLSRLKAYVGFLASRNLFQEEELVLDAHIVGSMQSLYHCLHSDPKTILLVVARRLSANRICNNPLCYNKPIGALGLRVFCKILELWD